MFEFLFSFDGRISRSQYWLAYVCWCGSGALLGASVFILTFLGLHKLMVGVAISALALLWYSGVCVTAKRLHDRDKSGWWQLIALIPLISLWLIFECGFLRGTPGRNRFGSDPLRDIDYALRVRPTF